MRVYVRRAAIAPEALSPIFPSRLNLRATSLARKRTPDATVVSAIVDSVR